MDRYFSITPEKKNQITIQLKHLLEKRHEVVFSVLHGSFLNNDKFKDIDVAVWVAERTVMKTGALDYELSTSVDLSYHLPYPIDVKVLNYAPLGFQYHAVSGSLLTCTDDDFRAHTVATIWIRYLDFLPQSKGFLLDMIS